MTWIDNLSRVRLADGTEIIGASFRGAVFFVSSSDRSGGRRSVTSEFVGRNNPYITDLGRRAKKINVTGHVIGDDYDRRRDELISALEDHRSPGVLVHPYAGRIRAVCETFTVRESSTDGGMAIFTITFVEAPEKSAAPIAVTNNAREVDDSASIARSSVMNELSGGYIVRGVPSFAFSSIENGVIKISSDLERRLSPLATSADILARMKSAINRISARIASIVRSPPDAISSVLSLLKPLGDSVTDLPKSAMDAIIGSYSVPVVPPIGGVTETRKTEAKNHSLMIGSIRTSLLIEASVIIPSISYESHRDAISDRDKIVSMIDTQMLSAGDDLYESLMSLRSSVLSAIPGRRELSRVFTVSQDTEIDSINLSMRIFGDLESENDIVRRNNIANPSFIAGNLDILSRAE